MTEQVRAGASSAARLPFVAKLQYGVGGMVEGVFNNALPTFLLFYLTSVAGVPGSLAGTAIALGTITDAVLDPLIGSATDNKRSRLGRRLPFMLASLPIIAASMALTFSLPSGLSDMLLFVWITLLSMISRTALSLFGITYQAVAAEVTEDYAERSSLIAWRWGTGLLGGVIAVVIGFNVFFAGPGGLSNRDAYPLFGVTIAAILVIAGLVGSRMVHGTLDRQHKPIGESGHGGLRVFREMGEVFRNPSFRVLATTALLLLAALAVHGGLAIHAGTFFWGLAPSQLQIIPIVTLLGLVVGAPLAGPLTKRIGKRGVALTGLVVLTIEYVAPPILRISGLLPLEDGGLVAFLAANAFIAGLLMSSAVIAVSSMLADATDEHEYLFGARREGLYFAAWLFAGKAAAGLGTMVAGFLVDLVHLPVAKGGHAAAAAAPAIQKLSAADVTHFGLVYALVPGLLVSASVVILVLYRLTAEKHASILTELHRRRSERQHTADASPA